MKTLFRRFEMLRELLFLSLTNTSLPYAREVRFFDSERSSLFVHIVYVTCDHSRPPLRPSIIRTAFYYLLLHSMLFSMVFGDSSGRENGTWAGTKGICFMWLYGETTSL